MKSTVISVRLKNDVVQSIRQNAVDRNMLFADWLKQAIQKELNYQLRKSNPHVREVKV